MSPTSNAVNPLFDGKMTVTEPAYLTHVLADRAVNFINRNRTQPFFLYLAFNAVHLPQQATEKYLKRFSHIPNERRRTYASMLSAMDDGIGKTLAALDDTTIRLVFQRQWRACNRRRCKRFEQWPHERVETDDVGRRDTCSVYR